MLNIVKHGERDLINIFKHWETHSNLVKHGHKSGCNMLKHGEISIMVINEKTYSRLINMFEWRLFDRIICYVWVWINDRYTWWKMKSPSTMHTYIKIKLYLKTMFVMFYKVFHYNLSAHFTMFENVDQVSLTMFDQVCNHDWNIIDQHGETW